MISVNQLFIDSCNSDCVSSQIKIRVSATKVGTVLCTLNDDEFNISSNSIEKQASSGASCNIGGVCSNKIKIVLNQKGIEKLNAVDGFKKNYVLHLIQWNKVNDNNQSEEDFSENLDHSENTTGKCDLGYYYISEIKNTYYDCEITAYDGMLSFEQALTISQLKYMMTQRKTVDQWLSYFCNLVNNGISYTVNSSVTCNNGVYFTLSDDSTFDKIRDAISQLAQLKMAYATINNQGNLTLMPAIKTNSNSYDDLVDNTYMFNSDNEVKESVIKHFYTSVAGFEYENNYTEEQGRNEINLYLEENKFLRGFEPYNGSALSTNTINCLRNMSNEVMGYSFYSCVCDINNRPYIELGDNIEVERKLVDQQGAVYIISIPCVVDSVSHEVGISTHITSNSTVGLNEGSNTKTRINSSTKDPSSSDILDILTSPIVNYTDTTATIKLRYDNDEMAAHTELDTYKDIQDSDFTYAEENYTWHNQTYKDYYINSTTIAQVIKERELKESVEGKYYFNSSVLDSDTKNTNFSYDIRLSINKKIRDLINSVHLALAVPSAIDNSVFIADAVIKAIYLCTVTERNRYNNNGTFNRNWSSPVMHTHFGEKNAHIPPSNTINGNGYYIPETGTTQCDFEYIKRVTIGTYLLSSSTQEITNDISVSRTVKRSYSTYNNSLLKQKNGFAIHNLIDAPYTHKFRVNPYYSNYKAVAKKLMALDSNLDFLWFLVEYINENSEVVQQYVHFYDFFNFLNFGYIKYKDGTYALDYFHIVNNEHNYLQETTAALTSAQRTGIDTLLNNLLDNIRFNISNYTVECNYLTSRAPLSSFDKESVDLGVVTESDLISRDEQIETNRQNIEKLNTYVDEVNADLQDAKGDIAQNTSDIGLISTRVATAEGNITQNTGDILGLDTRVTALEQGGGGGGSTSQEVVFTNANAHRIYDINTTPHTNRNYIFTNKIAQVGADFINLNTTYGTFYVDSEVMCDIRVYFIVGNLANNALVQSFELSLYESDTADLASITTLCATYAYNTEPVLEMVIPNVRLLVGKYYGFKPYGQQFSSNNNNQNGYISGSEWVSTRNRWRLYNYIQFIKKEGVTIYPPS